MAEKETKPYRYKYTIGKRAKVNEGIAHGETREKALKHTRKYHPKRKIIG